jgi:hypothetical protein
VANRRKASLARAPLSPIAEQVVSVAFHDIRRPLRISVNGQTGCFNPLPFSVLYVVVARFCESGRDDWPKGWEFTAKCAEFWKEIDPQRYRNPGPFDYTKHSKKWASWVDQTRNELVGVFPWMRKPKLQYHLLPNGRECRREGLCPTLARDCAITGLSGTIWSVTKTTTAA